MPRFLVFFGATLLEMRGHHGPVRRCSTPGGAVFPFGGIVAQAVGNALVGVVLFQLSDGVPRAARTAASVAGRAVGSG